MVYRTLEQPLVSQGVHLLQLNSKSQEHTQFDEYCISNAVIPTIMPPSLYKYIHYEALSSALLQRSFIAVYFRYCPLSCQIILGNASESSPKLLHASKPLLAAVYRTF